MIWWFFFSGCIHSISVAARGMPTGRHETLKMECSWNVSTRMFTEFDMY